MKNPELVAIIILVTFALVMVVVDVIVRLFVAPARKDRFLRDLLDHLVEGDPQNESAEFFKNTGRPSEDLQECLLRHFEKSLTSRQILNALADSGGLTQRDLLRELNQAFAAKGKGPLPLTAARRVAMILLHAGLLEVENGVLQITNVGQNLNLLLQTRKQDAIAR